MALQSGKGTIEAEEQQNGIRRVEKDVDGRIAMQDMNYVGKACYGRLDENLRGKIELGQGFLDSGYTRLTVSVLERTNGLVDQMKFLISDVTDLKQENDGERMAGPELSSYKDSVWWNCKMEETDYQKIAEAVNGYLSLFQSEELVQGQKEGESQGQNEQVGVLPSNILT